MRPVCICAWRKQEKVLPIKEKIDYNSVRNGIVRRFYKAHRLWPTVYVLRRYWQLWVSMGIETAAFSFDWIHTKDRLSLNGSCRSHQDREDILDAGFPFWRSSGVCRLCLRTAGSWDWVLRKPIAHQAPLSMGILQARILEQVTMPPSRESSRPRDQTQVSGTAGGFFTIWATR